MCSRATAAAVKGAWGSWQRAQLFFTGRCPSSLTGTHSLGSHRVIGSCPSHLASTCLALVCKHISKAIVIVSSSAMTSMIVVVITIVMIGSVTSTIIIAIMMIVFIVVAYMTRDRRRLLARNFDNLVCPLQRMVPVACPCHSSHLCVLWLERGACCPTLVPCLFLADG
jgi:hypothetical protein